MRAATGQAQGAATTAADTGANEGAAANGISANLTPFLTQELTHPQGYSQQDLTQQLNAGEAGAGGTTSGITGQAALQGARNRNPAGFTGALDSAARDRTKAAAATSEDIAAKDADVKQQQQQAGAKGLAGMYGEDTDAMLKSMGMVAPDVNSEVNASKTGWLQDAPQFVDLLKSIQGLGPQSGGGG